MIIHFYPIKSNLYTIIYHNLSYVLISSALTVLKNQSLQAEKDLDILLEMKDEALKDPCSFVQKIINKV